MSYFDKEIEVFCCSYCDKEFDTLKGVTCHENLYCKNKKKYLNPKFVLIYRNNFLISQNI